MVKITYSTKTIPVALVNDKSTNTWILVLHVHEYTYKMFKSFLFLFLKAYPPKTHTIPKLKKDVTLTKLNGSEV